MDPPWSIPRNIVYDRKPDKQAFLDAEVGSARWTSFWAIRYNLTVSRKVSPLRRMPLLRPDVLLVVDPTMRDGLPEDDRKRWAEFIRLRDLRVACSIEELATAVESSRPELVYWLSHAIGPGFGDEEISPRQLRRLLRNNDADDPYVVGGLAFLNACQTAQSSEAGSFFDALHSVGFSGMVGTENHTVDPFASPLGLTFLNEFLVNRRPLGDVMRGLRARVPLGLLYGTCCPPNVRIQDDGDESSKPSSVFIDQEDYRGGRHLGVSERVEREAPPLPDEPYRSLFDVAAVRDYLLTDFDEEALVEAITRPTEVKMGKWCSEVPYLKYGFRHEKGTAEEIARRVLRYTTQRRDSVLPLAQVTCTQLYHRLNGQSDAMIGIADLDRLGGIEGGMRRHVERLLSQLLKRYPTDDERLTKLFARLYLAQPDGSLTTALLPVDDVARRWGGRMPFEDLLKSAETLRLLRVNSLRVGGQEERRYVSLGHDALAKLAAQWDEELSLRSRQMKAVAWIAGSLTVAAVMAFWAWVAVRARHEAEENFKLARDSVDEYFTDIATESLLNVPGMLDLRRELLAKPVTFYEGLVEEHGDKVTADVVLVYFNLGEIEEAEHHYDKAHDRYQQAREIQTQIQSLGHKEKADLARTLMAIGRVKFEKQQPVYGLEEFQEAKQLRRELVRDQPENSEYELRLADSYMQIGLAREQRSEFEKAQEEMESAQEIREKHSGHQNAKRELGIGFDNPVLLYDTRLNHSYEQMDGAHRAWQERIDDAALEKAYQGALSQ